MVISIPACSGGSGQSADPAAVVVNGSDYDLNEPLSGSLDVNGALWTWPVPFNVGTGQIHPFLSVQANGQEAGFNTDASPLPLDTTRPNFTNALPLNHVPTIQVSGDLWREFILDANEANSGTEALFSIRQFDLWLCDDAGAPMYDAVSDFESNASCTLIYDLDGRIARATDAVTSGSGLDLDYQILIPEADFQAGAAALGTDLSGCQYMGGEADSCGLYLVLNVVMGDGTGDWVTGATFEEFSTINRPWVTVEKTATGTFTRTHQWSIEKIIFDPTENPALVNESQNLVVTYKATATTTGYVDSGWGVAGTITITNPSDEDVSITGVTDELTGGITADVTCPVTFPYVLPDGDTLVCTYSKALADGTDLTNTVTVALTDLAVVTDTADVTFGDPTTVIDECVDVSDLLESGGLPIGDPVDLGSACVADSPKTFTYTKTYGPAGIPLVCGDNTFDNTATLVTNDTETEDSDTESITITVDCPEGCSLTQGYWKTHNDSFHGGAPTDETWLLLGADAENTTFYLSGHSWFHVFWTAPAGNVYYNLAHQYMAAVLNILAGASAPANVIAGIAQAETWFSTYTPAQVKQFPKATRQDWVNLAGLLASYNEGLIEGFDHCTEDGTSAE